MNMENILMACCMLFTCIISLLGGNNCAGGVNEDLEIIKPTARKVRLSDKAKYFIPQWCKVAWRDPDGSFKKNEAFLLTVVLAICNYVFHLLCFIATIILFVLSPSDLIWMLLPIACALIAGTIITCVFEFLKTKAEDKNFGRIEKDFTITEKAESNRAEAAESATNTDRSE